MSLKLFESILDKDYLLILTGTYNVDSVISSIALTLYRYLNEKITHTAFIDTLLSDDILDLVEKYDDILILGLEDHVKYKDLAHELSSRNTIVISKYSNFTKDTLIEVLTIGDSSLSHLVYDVLSRRGVNRLISKVLMIGIFWKYFEEKSSIDENLVKEFVEKNYVKMLDAPPLPGITWRKLCEALTLSLWPYIHEVTGNFDNVLNFLKELKISDDVKYLDLNDELLNNLFRRIVLHMLDKGFTSQYIDLLLSNNYLLDDVDVLEYLLTLEAIMGIQDSAYHPLSILVKGKELIRSSSVVKLCHQYIEDLARAFSKVLTYKVEDDFKYLRIVKFDKKLSQTLLVRLCYLLSKLTSSRKYCYVIHYEDDNYDVLGIVTKREVVLRTLSEVDGNYACKFFKNYHVVRIEDNVEKFLRNLDVIIDDEYSRKSKTTDTSYRL